MIPPPPEKKFFGKKKKMDQPTAPTTLASYQGAAFCGASDVHQIPNVVLSLIFNKLEPQDWFGVVSACKRFLEISKALFRGNFLTKMLSNQWQGWCGWESYRLQEIALSKQDMEAVLNFAVYDNKLSPNNITIFGNGHSTDFQNDWKITGEFDINTSNITWQKQYIGGQYDGRQIKYAGKLSLANNKATIQGDITLESLDNTAPDQVGDHGKFCITSSAYKQVVMGEVFIIRYEEWKKGKKKTVWIVGYGVYVV